MSLGILCPGQGDQSPDMFELVSGEPEAQNILALYRDMAGGPSQDLHMNRVAQPLLCAFQLAVWKGLQKELPEPKAFAGYSLGELSAYGCAGVLAPEELIKLAQHRAAAMDEAYPSPGGSQQCGGSRKARCSTCAPSMASRLQSSMTRTGSSSAAPQAPWRNSKRRLPRAGRKSRGSRCQFLRIPLRCRPRVPKFRMALSQAAWAPFAAPVLSGTTAAPVFSKAEAIEALALQIAHRIDWAACVGALVELGCTVLLELGPGNGLSRMVRDRFPDLQARSVTEFRTLRGVASWMKRSLSN